AAQAASRAIQSTQQACDGALERLDDKVHQLRTDAAPVIERAGEKADQWVQKGARQLNEGSRQLRAKAQYVAAESQQYVREQPVKSVLIAAGIGALLMGLISVLARQGSGR
ncbi:MAG TPA: hypothetical protein PLT77_09395, partial [Burkholderiaceae bacterium]|nr:hypothetical protein [Burkholderiaceae bacterium]